MGRRPCCEKVGLRKGRWTAEEDEILIKYIQENGEGSWRSLPKNAGLSRCGKSCRLRWINYLRSDLKRGNISSHEEDVIVKLHASLGNRWSVIAGHLPGRTDNEIKNYWNSHLCRQIHVFRRVARADSLPVVLDAAIISKQRGGRKSRQTTATNKSSNSKESPAGDVLFPSTPELAKEILAELDERENNGEKDSYGETSILSSNGDERESENSIQKETVTVKEQLGNSNNGGLLGFNELLDSGSMEERESSSSFDDLENLGWESLIQGEELWNGDKATMASLWEEDDWKLNNFENSDQRNLVSWLFS